MLKLIPSTVNIHGVRHSNQKHHLEYKVYSCFRVLRYLKKIFKFPKILTGNSTFYIF